MFFYQTKDRLSYEEINTKTIQLFEFYSNKKKKSNNSIFCIFSIKIHFLWNTKFILLLLAIFQL
jgi:hypothetical protein